MINDSRTINKCRSNYHCQFCGGSIKKGTSYTSLETFWGEYSHSKVHNECYVKIEECFKAGCDEDAWLEDIFDFYEGMVNGRKEKM